jgi:hypothetical protein
MSIENTKNYADINLLNYSCAMCQKGFTKEDLKEKIHQTAFNYFFHDACVKWVIDVTRDRVEVQSRGVKRKREEPENQADNQGPAIEKNDCFSYTKEIFYTIAFGNLETSLPESFNVSCKAILQTRLVSKQWAELLSYENVSRELKIYLKIINKPLQSIRDDPQVSPLLLACESKESQLVKILLDAAIDPLAVIEARDCNDYSSFHTSLLNVDAINLEHMLKTIEFQSHRIDYSSRIDGDMVDNFLTYNPPFGMEKLEIVKLLTQSSELMAKEIFDKASCWGISPLLNWFCDEYFNQYSDKTKVADFICSPFSSNDNLTVFHRGFNVDPNLMEKLITLAGARALEAIRVPLTSKHSTMLSEDVHFLARDFTPLHAAAMSGGLSSAKAIVKAAGSEALNLLKAPCQELEFFPVDLNSNLNIRHVTPLALACHFQQLPIAIFLAQTMITLAKEQNDIETINYVNNFGLPTELPE